jgi:hypothetical protein
MWISIRCAADLFRSRKQKKQIPRLNHENIADAVHGHGVYDAVGILVHFTRDNSLAKGIEEWKKIRLNNKRE